MACELIKNSDELFMNFDTISVVGLGYIGLPTAAVIASRKKRVIGIDINQHAVDTINKGEIHIVEPELDILVHAVVTEGFLRATTIPEPADAFLIAVPTPFKGDHEPDLSYIESAVTLIAPVLERGNLVILESTSPVGATEKMAAWLAKARPDLTFPQSCGEGSDIRVAHCPERVLPGHVIRELVENDRVIGGLTLKCSEAAVNLYKIFVDAECVITNARTAEMAKLTENSFRDVNIAFANELSVICDKLNINVWELIKLANRHPRVDILQPGAGVGGHCIAVDPWFIVSTTPEEAKLIHKARLVNEGKPDWVVAKIESAVLDHLRNNPGKVLTDIKIACMGLAFKPDIDDLRESPALDIAKTISQKFHNQVYVVEPNIEHTPAELGKVELLDTESAIKVADIIVVLVKHGGFEGLEDRIQNGKTLLDVVGLTSK